MLSLIRRHSLIIGCLCIILTVFCLAGRSVGTHTLTFLCIASAGLLFLLLSFFERARFLRPYRRTIAVSVVCTLLAILSCFFVIERKNAPVRALADTQNTYHITGYTADAGSDGTYGTTIVKVTSMDGKECNFDLLLLRAGTPAPKPYRYFTAEIVFDSDDSLLDRYRDENVAACANVRSLSVTANNVKSLGVLFYRLSSSIQDLFHRHLDPETATFACALLLGQQNGLSTEIHRDFRCLGISHTLAVSGLHLTVLTAALLFLLGIVRAGRKTRMTVIILFLILFVGLCGFSPSVLRAALMSVGLLVANAMGERISGLRTLCISLACILLFCPYLIYSVSLQLSALATLGILVLYPLFATQDPKPSGGNAFRKAIRFFLYQCALTVAATIFTLPVLYLQFGAVSLASLFANLFFVPLVNLMLYLLPAFLILLPIPGISLLLRYAVTGLYTCIRSLAGLARYCKNLYCYIPLWVLIVIALVLLTVPLFCLIKRGKYASVSLLLLVVSLFLCYPVSMTGGERMLYHYDGQRETLLLADQNKVVFIETGNASHRNASVALDEALHTLHQTGIDTLMLTHYHSTSLSFVKYLCESTYLDTLYLPAPQTETDHAIENQIRTLANEKKVRTLTYDSQESLTVYGFDLRIHTERLNRSEHPTQAIEIKCRGGRVLAADPSVFELDGIGAPDLSGVDHLIFLESPPVDKYPLPRFRGQETVHALYASQNQFALLGCPFGSHTVLTEDKTTALIRFKNTP